MPTSKAFHKLPAILVARQRWHSKIMIKINLLCINYIIHTGCCQHWEGICTWTQIKFWLRHLIVYWKWRVDWRNTTERKISYAACIIRWSCDGNKLDLAIIELCTFRQLENKVTAIGRFAVWVCLLIQLWAHHHPLSGTNWRGLLIGRWDGARKRCG